MKTKNFILSGNGFNCEAATKAAIELAGGQAFVIHIEEWLKKPNLILEFQSLTIPGGFSYGDVLGSGNLMALKIQAQLQSALKDYLKAGGLILGICNGFQVLTRLGLLPDQSWNQKLALIENEGGSFVNKWVKMKKNPLSPSLFLRDLPNEFYLPIRHGEGKIWVPEDQKSTWFTVKQNSLIALEYTENVNGSLDQAAALCDRSGRILGMMPHPEGFIDQNQYFDQKNTGRPVGLKIFENMISWIQRERT